MFKKFFKFLYGYVIIKVYGKGAERFINICLRRNIDVWNIKPFDDGIEMCIYITLFSDLTYMKKILYV
uniref:sporulation protein YqfD n=1 Tax=Hominilimicola sp. TaxID=3073571 RepID=UPI00307B9174